MNAKKITAILALALAHAALPLRAADCGCIPQSPEAAGHPGSVPVLLGLDPVRKELKLTAAQTAELDQIRSGFKSAARRLTAQPPATQAARRSAEVRLASLKGAADASALAVLTPVQQSRLAQIEHHVLGASMLAVPSVQKSLGLSASQIAGIDKIRQSGLAFAGAVNRRFENGEIGHQERLAILHARRIKQAKAMAALLTPAQRKALDARRGKPLTTT